MKTNGFISRRTLFGALAAAIGPVFCAAWAGDGNDLRRAIEALIRDSGAADVGVAYRDLATGEELLVHGDATFHAASTMKVPVLMELYRQAGAGTLSLDDRMAVKIQFASIVDGSPYTLKAEDDSETSLYRRVGERLTIRELARLMITESSNVATNMLIERITAARTCELMERLGTKDIHVLRGVEDGRAYARGMNNTTTARALMIILTRLAGREVVSRSASDEMLAILRAQKFAEGIPAGVPADRGVKVAHKTGWFPGVYHDAAIVEPPRGKPFVLVVLTRGIKDDRRAHRLVADITRLVYRHAEAARRR